MKIMKNLVASQTIMTQSTVSYCLCGHDPLSGDSSGEAAGIRLIWIGTSLASKKGQKRAKALTCVTSFLD